MPTEADAIKVLDEWYASLPPRRNRLPARGSITAALIVIARLRTDFDLSISAHVTTEGQAQVRGLSGSAVRKISAEFGETRKLTAEGGRSNRGARGVIERLLHAIGTLQLEKVSDAQRHALLNAMLRRIVIGYIARYFEAMRVKATFDARLATSRFVREIIENARQTGKESAVAEYLVGAKLTLLYPEKEIRNKALSAADAQAGEEGDFLIGTTVFHVTISPMGELFEKIQGNLERGFRVYLIVLQSNLEGARQLSDTQIPGRIEVDCVEAFVSRNVDEMVEFDGANLKSGLRRLLETYNARVDQVESDKSLLIEIPPNLQ